MELSGYENMYNSKCIYKCKRKIKSHEMEYYNTIKRRKQKHCDIIISRNT